MRKEEDCGRRSEGEEGREREEVYAIYVEKNNTHLTLTNGGKLTC